MFYWYNCWLVNYAEMLVNKNINLHTFFNTLDFAIQDFFIIIEV